MNQCVPSWDLDENPISPRLPIRAQSNSNSSHADVPTLDYEVAELTWENGQLAMHALGLPRVPSKSSAAGGTLESIVNQATCSLPHNKSAMIGAGGRGCAADELVAWYVVPPSTSGSATMTMDALVPCTNKNNNTTTNNNNNNCHQRPSAQPLESAPGAGKLVGGSSTRVGSCSGARNVKMARASDIGGSHDWSSRADYSVSNSATCGRDSRQVTLDSCDRELGTAGFTSTSMGSPGNTSSAMQWTKTADDDHDSVCHGRQQSETGDEGDKKKGTGKGSVSTKRSRAAAIHNQSERKRRDKINQRMKTLQKMIPNSNKTDKASMLDEVIEYLKQLQAQIQMMSRMNMPHMMLPVAMQQQLQMSMMAPMGMGVPGLGMGMGVMDMNSMGRGNIPGLPPVLHPSAFMPPMAASWDGSGGDRLPSSAPPALPDPLAAFLACQSQPMAMDAYTRMAAMYQQFQQPPGGPGSKN